MLDTNFKHMKIINKILLVAIGFIACFAQSCQEDYYFDGGSASPELNMSTYDFITSREEFSMAKFIIDKDEELKVSINTQGNTVFVPRNKNIEGYIGQMAWGDQQFEHFEADRIEIMVKAMKQYVFAETLRSEDAPSLGKAEVISIAKDTLNIYKLQSPYNGVQSAGPEFLYLDKKLVNPKTKEVVFRVGKINSSNLVSTNGMVHVMDYYHTFGFNL